MAVRIHLGAIALLAAACSSKPAPEAHAQVEPHRPAPPGRAVDLPGDSNGAYWDASTRSLYIVDDTFDQLVRWTDAEGFRAIGAFPPATKVSLGGLVRAGAGFVTTSFGFGDDGGAYMLAPGVPSPAIDNLAPERRRIGLASGPDGAIYEAFFVVHGHDHAGGVARLDLAGGETDVISTGLRKPVGVAVTATTLYVSDQEQDAIFAYPLAADGSVGAPTTIARDLPSADLLTALPGGDLVTGGKHGAVYRITPAGKVSTIADGFEQVRGTAYDPAGKRLFVIEHSAATSRHKLHIVALDGGAPAHGTPP